MRLRLLLIPLGILALALFAACGGDDDDDDAGDNGDAPAEATDAPGDGGGDPTDASGDDDDDDDNGGVGFGSGTATLTIGDETWDFDNVLCALSTEQSGSEESPFNLSAFGEGPTGNRTQLYADIYDSAGEGRTEGEGVSYLVSLDDVEDFENSTISWSINDFEVFGGSPPDFQLDGKNLNVSGVFDNGLTEDEMEAIPGTLVATCP